MSHFSLLVITPFIETSSFDYNTYVKTVLCPYCEYIEVPEYTQKCWCAEGNAKEVTTSISDKKFGSINELWMQYHNSIFKPEPPKPFNEMSLEEINEYSDKFDKAWEKFIQERKKFEEETFKIELEKATPNKNCDNCHGSGFYKSTYNPDSKWDWYKIGGRWDGFHHKEKLNIFRVEELSGRTFAILTPDNRWHEKGKMMWFALVKDENTNWQSEYDRIISKHKQNYAVIVDCHI